MKLVIGTANFSKLYGLENKMVKKKNLKNIFIYLYKKKLFFFDCSEDYMNIKHLKNFSTKSTFFIKLNLTNLN